MEQVKIMNNMILKHEDLVEIDIPSLVDTIKCWGDSNKLIVNVLDEYLIQLI